MQLIGGKQHPSPFLSVLSVSTVSTLYSLHLPWLCLGHVGLYNLHVE